MVSIILQQLMQNIALDKIEMKKNLSLKWE